MLTKIDRIEGLGVFDGYAGHANLEEFARFNIIYGLNGSGKTTLSRLLNCLNAGISTSYPSLKYKVTAEEGNYKEGQKYPCKIRVFNSDYIESNLGEIEGQLNPIYIVGEENKSLADQIEKDEGVLQRLQDEERIKQSERSRLEKDKGKKFTDVAKIIASETSGQAIRNYRKPDAEKAFAKITDECPLDQKVLDKFLTTVRQAPLESITIVEVELEKTSHGGQTSDFSSVEVISQIERKTEGLLKKTSDSIAINRLRDNPEIAKWVERGFELHNHKENITCEYCQQPIPTKRIEQL